MTKLVKQQYDTGVQRKDCFLCCIAMLFNKDYAWAWQLLHQTQRDMFSTRGPRGAECDEVFARFALRRANVGAHSEMGEKVEDDYFLIYMRPDYATNGFVRNILWGRRAFLQVRSKNYEGEMHIIYWDGAVLFDPSNLQTYKWDTVEPVYVWLFNEVTVAR